MKRNKQGVTKVDYWSVLLSCCGTHVAVLDPAGNLSHLENGGENNYRSVVARAQVLGECERPHDLLKAAIEIYLPKAESLVEFWKGSRSTDPLQWGEATLSYC